MDDPATAKRAPPLPRTLAETDLRTREENGTRAGDTATTAFVDASAEAPDATNDTLQRRADIDPRKVADDNTGVAQDAMLVRLLTNDAAYVAATDGQATATTAHIPAPTRKASKPRTDARARGAAQATRVPGPPRASQRARPEGPDVATRAAARPERATYTRPIGPPADTR